MPEVVSGWWRHCHPELYPENPVTSQHSPIAREPIQAEKLPEPTAKDLENTQTASSEWKDPAKYKNRRKSECHIFLIRVRLSLIVWRRSDL